VGGLRGQPVRRRGDDRRGAPPLKLDRHYVDPRLVELYDIENPRGPDSDFLVDLARDIGARTIVDLGCGTGVVARDLASEGRRVVGVDPSAAMLSVARGGPSSVRWIQGDSSALGRWDADLVVMTGHVAQVFLDDDEWHAALCNIREALRPGGYLVFDSRNPARREWERWDPKSTFSSFASPHGDVETWLEVLDVRDGCVTLRGHNVFQVSGDDVVSDSVLRFRERAAVEESLVRAGFSVDRVNGDWSGAEASSENRTFVFVARASRGSDRPSL
jgi:SAM-dependent methyltransferase